MSAAIRARRPLSTVLLVAAICVAPGRSAKAGDAWPAAWPAPGKAEARILAELENETVMEFIDTPLRDVVDFVRDHHGIPIVIDNPSLEEVGIGTDVPMTTNLRGISLRRALKLLLDPLDLEVLVRDEVLFITTREEAEAHREVRVYDVSNLLGDDKDAGRLAELVQLALHDCPPGRQGRLIGGVGMAGMGGMDGSVDSMAGGSPGDAFGGGFGGIQAGQGGPASGQPPVPGASARVLFYRHLLIVRDTQQGHRRLAEFLAALESGLEK
jgi:hypothetical protein